MNGFIIIPVRDEEESIALVIEDILRLGIINESAIIVVDNASIDSTVNILKKYNITYLYQDQPGYGSACLRGLEYISSLSQFPDWVSFMDGDFSDYAEDLFNLIGYIDRGEAEFVSGDRTYNPKQKRNLEFFQKLGNSIICILLYIFFRKKFRDIGPLRVIQYNKFIDLNMQDTSWGWNIEMNIKAIRNKLKILEVPVRYRKRHSGKSKISGNWKMIVPVGYRIILTFFKLLLFTNQYKSKT